MSGPGGAGPDPSLTGGEFLLSLLQKSPQHHQQQQQSHQLLDPSVAATFEPLAFRPNHNNNNQPPHLHGFAADGAAASALLDSGNGGLGLGFQPRQEPFLIFGSFRTPIRNRETLLINSRNVGLPPEFVGAGKEVERRDLSEVDLAGKRILGDSGLGKQFDHPESLAGSKLHSVGVSYVEKSNDDDDIDELSKEIGDSLGIDDDGVDDNIKNFIKKSAKVARSDARGHQRRNKKQRIHQRQIKCRANIHKLDAPMKCRANIHKLDAPMIAIIDSLIPSEEEKAKQKQLLGLLERLVNREWPNAKLYIYGSRANSFGFSKSDIDICFALEGTDNKKPEIILRLAEIFESENLKNVQALVQTRVPIVELTDPATDISCDISINNILAIVNTKLLRDYAQIDARLRQLVFIVKHWAKSRRVNKTYNGTLSSYAYVLMCIHFLQKRRPAILPCLQKMNTTYSVTIENVHCAFFDQVDRLHGFGHRNNETISMLVWSFFNYWAYVHDYANSVISVRTGTLLRLTDAMNASRKMFVSEKTLRSEFL